MRSQLLQQSQRLAIVILRFHLQLCLTVGQHLSTQIERQHLKARRERFVRLARDGGGGGGGQVNRKVVGECTRALSNQAARMLAAEDALEVRRPAPRWRRRHMRSTSLLVFLAVWTEAPPNLPSHAPRAVSPKRTGGELEDSLYSPPISYRVHSDAERNRVITTPLHGLFVQCTAS